LAVVFEKAADLNASKPQAAGDHFSAETAAKVLERLPQLPLSPDQTI